MGRRNRHRKQPAAPTSGPGEPTVAVPNEVPVPADADGEDGGVACMSEDVYSRERSLLVEIEQKSASQHDRAILTLTAGALALSITFLEKIAPKPAPSALWLIAAAWLCFIVGLCVILLSFLLSQTACRRQRELLNAAYSEQAKPRDEENRAATWTSRLNWASYGLFLLGVLFLALFSWFNIPSGG